MTKSLYKSRDVIHIDRLLLKAMIGCDFWGHQIPQNVEVSVDVLTDFRKASNSDDLKYSLNYATLCKEIKNYVATKGVFKSLGQLARDIKNYSLTHYSQIEQLSVKVRCGTCHIRCNDISVCVDSDPDVNDKVVISNLNILTIIGVYMFERHQKQNITLGITLPWLKSSTSMPLTKSIMDRVIDFVELSSFKTVEALVQNVSELILKDDYFKQNSDLEVIVKTLKMNAITETKGVGVTCVRKYTDFVDMPSVEFDSFKSIGGSNLLVNSSIKNGERTWNKAILAFGSNLGDKFANIVSAISLLEADVDIKVIQISSLFESNPMYVKDQQNFMNGAIEIATRYLPDELLKVCKEIEYQKMKRIKEYNNGPRVIDLDIIFFKDSSGEHCLIDTDDLVIPHPRMLERSFVLEPVCELISVIELHPVTLEPVYEHLKQLYMQRNKEDQLLRLLPIPAVKGTDKSTRFMRFKQEYVRDGYSNSMISRTRSNTYIMGIVNVTPDSFSDGHREYNDISIQMKKIKEMVNNVLSFYPVVIIDIGGCSTRPGGDPASQEEELSRVIPIIKALRQCDEISQESMIISIDTYRAEVARQAVMEGADIINDISGAIFDIDILSVVAENPRVAYVLSHFKDWSFSTDSSKIDACNVDKKATDFFLGKFDDSSELSFISGLGRELAERYLVALQKGVKRWQIILDPGIGFSKFGNQNLDILRGIPHLKNYSYVKGTDHVSFRNLPVMIGPSRKKFIGILTQEKNPSDLDFSTGALASCSVGYDVDIIRVHDVADCTKSIKLADVLYRAN